jgi:hypothetical protein
MLEKQSIKPLRASHIKWLAWPQRNMLVKAVGLIIFLIPCVILITLEDNLPGKILALISILAVWLGALGLTWQPGLSGLLAGALLLIIFRSTTIRIIFFMTWARCVDRRQKSGEMQALLL